MPIDKATKIYVAGHRGMVGSAIVRRLQQGGYSNLLTRTRQELDLLDQRAVFDFLATEKPGYILAGRRINDGMGSHVAGQVAACKSCPWGEPAHVIRRAVSADSYPAH